MLAKAYPGLEGNTDLYEEMAVEQLIRGLNDPSLIYDVRTKRPKTVQEAIDMVQWHESCKLEQQRA